MIYEKKKLKKISFPLGGIGTGSVGLAGNGSFRDWEIFNRPNKHSQNGFTHFALRVTQGEESVSKVLQGDCVADLGDFSCGTPTQTMAGFPHFRDVSFEGRFPVAQLRLSEENFPIVARLTAFNPFIPHNEDDSSLPVAMFEWELENVTDRDADCALGFSLRNPSDSGVNTAFGQNGGRGIYMRNTAKGEDDTAYFDLCMLCDGADTIAEEYWYRGRWQDAQSVYWRNFTEMDRMPKRTYPTAGKNDHATLVSYLQIPAKACRRVRFVMAWNAPNMYNYWAKDEVKDWDDCAWKNYYATLFENSRATAEYAMAHFDVFYEKTKVFADALQACSLSETVIDAISSNLSVLKSPTVFRLTDGSLWGWEGVHNTNGSCEGSCQHVWNYAYALPFLFPRLERSLRDVTLKYSLGADGKSSFRIMLPLGRKPWSFRACVDGQMGEVIKCYREWKISGDTEWLRANAEGIFSMLEYAWSPENPDRWDADMDGVMEGRQHHTLDMELFGPSAWLEGFYLLALDCGAKMAEKLGEAERAKKYRAMYENGRAWMNEHLFNGEYFCQKIDLGDMGVLERFGTEEDQSVGTSYWNAEAGQIKYQIGDGCIIDQMLAEWHGAIIGAAPIFDAEKKRKALESLYRYNYVSSMRDVENMWRLFAVDDEAGTIICSYPDRFEKPIIPIPYCEEVMTGFEYAAAGLMLANGYTTECETMVKAIRDRYDGEKRNPWDEIECGHNYARTMASYALMLLWSGFAFDMTEKYVGFFPVTEGDGQYVWSVGNTWGKVCFEAKKCTLAVRGAPLTLAAFGLKDARSVTLARIDGEEIAFDACDGKIRFAECSIANELVVQMP
ncbi:MAG: hypothetical protein E7643_04755 [Ruminococcaceae bacterium]|nr:hypothetical protein [Oscillospiraceae bacterium]